MKSLIKYIFFVAIAVLFSACELLVDAVTDDSIDTLVHRIDYPLSSILLKKDMDMEIVESNDNELIIEGPKAVLESFTFKTDSGKLTLFYDKYGSWMYDKPKVQLRIPKLCKIELYFDNALSATDTLFTKNIDIYSDGTNDIDLMVNCETLNIYGNYLSNFHISGKTEDLKVTTTHGSIFYGARLLADSITCNSNGSNKQIVNPTKLLRCNVNYSGNIYYVNQPDELIINRHKKVSGQVIFDSNKQ